MKNVAALFLLIVSFATLPKAAFGSAPGFQVDGFSSPEGFSVPGKCEGNELCFVKIKIFQGKYALLIGKRNIWDVIPQPIVFHKDISFEMKPLQGHSEGSSTEISLVNGTNTLGIIQYMQWGGGAPTYTLQILMDGTEYKVVLLPSVSVR